MHSSDDLGRGDGERADLRNGNRVAMQIKVLGCSGGVGPGLRTTTLLVDGEILVDAGTGVGDLTLGQMRRIGRVFLTHSHLDHVCGLAFMADNLFDEIQRPIQVMAPGETLRILRRHLFNWKLWPDFSRLPDKDAPVLSFRSIRKGRRLKLGDDRFIQAFEVNHTVPAVGYVLSTRDKVFAFTGDTGSCPGLWQFLNELERLDYLMIDVAFPDEERELGRISGHYTPDVLGAELEQLRHRPELLLTHHKPGSAQVMEAQCNISLKAFRHRHLKRGDVFDI